uniref:DUF4283 domain-containing protein n=1 Tax=Cannabis sativa TaxID=3483 RepID=A0A803Q814_CANSA
MASSSLTVSEIEGRWVEISLEEEDEVGISMEWVEKEEVAIDTRWCLFYHEVDMIKVLVGSSWTFDKKQLIIPWLKLGENSRLVKLNHLDLWVHIHDLEPSAPFFGSFCDEDVGGEEKMDLAMVHRDFASLWDWFEAAMELVEVDKLAQVVVETNSLVVIQSIDSDVKMFLAFGLMIQDCKNLLGTLTNVVI